MVKIFFWVMYLVIALTFFGSIFFLYFPVQAGGTIIYIRGSVASFGGQANNHSDFGELSGSGNAVAFESFANNLTGGDLSTAKDIFLHDFGSERTYWISVSDSGDGGNHHSYHPSVSYDGRFTAFETDSTNFVLNSNGFFQIYVRDLEMSDTELISISTTGSPGNGDSRNASISGDGQYIVFESMASNLVDGDTNEKSDIFIRDRFAQTTESLIINDPPPYWGSGNSTTPVISEDGRYIVFSYEDSLIPPQLLLFDRVGQTIERISVNSSEDWANGGSYNPDISAGGRFVTFESLATNLSNGDSFEFMDIYIRDRANGTTKRITLSTNNGNPNGNSWYPSISRDGKYIAYLSTANNLVIGTQETFTRIYRYNTQTHETEVVAPVASAGGSIEKRPSISALGNEIAFASYFSNIVPDDTNNYWDIFIAQFPYEIYLPIIKR